ncbi:hypothetical protein QTO34_003988 [Cnephaeus nilssonii]|uniref:GED domain-containing protein n=1 Tax=Cnephaeus nilssonii TaxID=3371016 RepID=A0AA40HSH7_CNENI|nr:hypothetical protein QTO34_003988 [Eptesicus nilssonii]
MGLESRVRGLAAENQELRAENRELGKRVQALQEESRYLRAVLANETGLARLLSRLSGVGLRLTTSLFRDSPAGDHDYALPVGKQQQQQQQQDLLEEDDSAGGVCLHVDKDKVSVEFCSACARKASSSLKMCKVKRRQAPPGRLLSCPLTQSRDRIPAVLLTPRHFLPLCPGVQYLKLPLPPSVPAPAFLGPKAHRNLHPARAGAAIFGAT